MSLLAITGGWIAGNCMFLAVIGAIAPGTPWQLWVKASAWVCLGAWILIGIPFATTAGRIPPGGKRARAILFSGLAGFGIVLLTLGPGAIGSSFGFLIAAFAGGQALATGGVSMLLYCLMLDRIGALPNWRGEG